MNKQRKVVITTTYNEMGIIIDTKVEEVVQPNLQPTCNQLATDCISRHGAIDHFKSIADATSMGNKYNEGFVDGLNFAVGHLETMPSVQPVDKDINVSCKDAISRQGAIDAFGLSEKTRKYGGDHSGYDTRMLYEIQDVLEELPSVQPYTDEQIQRMQNMEQAQLDKAFELGREDAKPQWIPCSERLPEHSGWYIVTKKLTDDGDKAVCLSWYSFHGWEWGENPIAWMPMPEPYKEEGEPDGQT